MGYGKGWVRVRVRLRFKVGLWLGIRVRVRFKVGLWLRLGLS
jgi:hypothetical protein